MNKMIEPQRSLTGPRAPAARAPEGAAAFLLISFALYLFLPMVFWGTSNPFDMMKNGLASGAIILAYLAYRRSYSACSWEVLGFVRPLPSDAVLGVFIAAATLASDVICRWLHLFPSAGEANRLSADINGPATLALYCMGLIGLAFAEECIFRSYLIPALEARMRTAYAVFLSSVAFGIPHLQFGVPSFVSGLILGGVFAWRRSVWPVVIAHFLHNVTVTFVGYYLLERAAR